MRVKNIAVLSCTKKIELGLPAYVETHLSHVRVCVNLDDHFSCPVLIILWSSPRDRSEQVFSVHVCNLLCPSKILKLTIIVIIWLNNCCLLEAIFTQSRILACLEQKQNALFAIVFLPQTSFPERLVQQIGELIPVLSEKLTTILLDRLQNYRDSPAQPPQVPILQLLPSKLLKTPIPEKGCAPSENDIKHSVATKN